MIRLMSKILDEVLHANKAYAANFGELGKLAMPPARRFAILTNGNLLEVPAAAKIGAAEEQALAARG
jgi:hypothetical protein